MRLRRRRAAHAGRRSGRWRLPIFGGTVALVVGAACWAPLAPIALAPSMPIDETPALAVRQTGLGVAVVAPAAIVVPTVGARPNPTPIPIPLPLVVPTPRVLPALSPTGQALLASVKSDRTSQWVKNHTETALRSGPDDTSVVFTRLPQWTTLKQIESRPDWLLVEYGGDGATREAGPGWVSASDVGGVDPPSVWLSSSRPGAVWSSADVTATRIVDVPGSALMEVIGPDYVSGTRAHVRLPGDGRSVPPTQGWVDGEGLTRARTPGYFDVPVAYPADLRADVRINVPYRTQLDGSDYAGANCGPTVLGMALESFGMNVPPPEVRSQVLTSEDFDPSDTDAGSYIWALARVAQAHGLKPYGLYDLNESGDGSELHRWTVDELRASVKQNRPVIVQVYYRGLPGREGSSYYGDHYIILTGLMGDDFLYNDPIGGPAAREVPGYDRLITASQLRRAMRASDSGYQFTAFGVSRT